MYFDVLLSTGKHAIFFLQWLFVAEENRFRRGHDGRECPVKITRPVSKFHLRLRLYSFPEKSETRTCYTFFNLHNVRGVTTNNDGRHHVLAFGVRFPSSGVSHMLSDPSTKNLKIENTIDNVNSTILYIINVLIIIVIEIVMESISIQLRFEDIKNYSNCQYMNFKVEFHASNS